MRYDFPVRKLPVRPTKRPWVGMGTFASPERSVPPIQGPQLGSYRRTETPCRDGDPSLWEEGSPPYVQHNSSTTIEEVIQLATKEQTDQAITAVANGQASREQQDIAKRAASQAGSTGNRAREAFKGR